MTVLNEKGLEAGLVEYDRRASHSCNRDALRAAITAYLEHSGKSSTPLPREYQEVAWRCERGTNDWVYYTDYGSAHIHELHGGVIAEPLYPASAIQALVSERDEARAAWEILHETVARRNAELERFENGEVGL